MVKNKIKLAIGVALTSLLMAGPVVSYAEEDPIAARQALVAKIKKIIDTPADKAKAIKKGKDRTLFCSNCHGPDGNSKRPEIPNMAGQNPAYIVEQMDKFASGERKSLVMQTLSQGFTEQDKINIAVFYNSQKVVKVDFDPTKVQFGKMTYERLCVFCHSKSGKGEEGFARIAGQKPVYVVNTLKRFRNNANNVVNVLGTKRSSARMEQVTQALTDNDINNLAAYIASME
jgi:cytochrome c553